MAHVHAQMMGKSTAIRKCNRVAKQGKALSNLAREGEESRGLSLCWKRRNSQAQGLQVRTALDLSLVVRISMDSDTGVGIWPIDALVRSGILRVANDGRKRRSYMAKKQSSDKTSSLASKVLSGAKKPTLKDAKKLAASVLSQDEKKGKRGR